VTLYLHAFVRTDDGDHVGVIQIDSLPALVPYTKMIRVRSIGGAGEMVRGDTRPFMADFELRPGNRYFVCDNDPDECMRPNGKVIWRWEGLSTDSLTVPSEEVV
jgi:hypothetical protein